ncbi:MAG: type II secretion system protein [Oscillospiraceae bacterium]|nr:type II secretion system protein [Oscillospiraceae bacterium]
MKTSNRRVKGFTLIEMVVVIAIIGALLGVFAPAMSNYYWKSRVKAANAEAKMIYNAAQTEVQKYIAFDRANPENPLKDYSSSKQSHLSGYYMITYSPSGIEIYSIDATSLSKSSGNLNIAGSSSTLQSAVTNIVTTVNNTVSDAETKCWAICVNNYIVKSCIAADQTTTPYVGYYSTGRITLPAERPTVTYSSWLTGNDAENSLLGRARGYDNAS